jgi:acylglycerol lipase
MSSLVAVASSTAQASSWTHPDGTRRAITYWPATSPHRSAIVFVHGFGEHMGRFQSFADGLSPLGLNAIGFDHVGHGKSDGARGDAPSIDGLADDLGLILPSLLKQAGATQAIALGHSMGALTLARYLTRGNADPSIRAAILSGPAFLVPKPWLVRIKVAIGRIIAPLSPRMSFAAGVDAHGLSHDSAVIEAYKRDPLVHGSISARLGQSLIDDGERYADDGEALAIPTLLYHGGSDPIACVEGSRRFAKTVRKDLLTYHEWPGYFHEPHHELPADREKVFTFIRDWIGRTVPDLEQ